MADRLFIRDYLTTFFEEVAPRDFYRAIFPSGELACCGEQISGKYNAIALELLPKENEKSNVRRYILTDELQMLDKLLDSDNFIIVSPISYIGKSRQSKNARFIYAIAIDLDGITEQHYLADLFHQINIEYLPKPTYTVWSGTGLHLYYQLQQPLPCFKNIVKQLQNLKNELTRKIWNGYVSSLSEKPQIESLFQGFRLVGGVTKGGNRTAAFNTGEPVNIEYLNNFVSEPNQIKEFRYKTKLTIKEAAAKYPEWYDKRVINKQPKGSWVANKAVYDWWYEKLKDNIQVGHRYYGVMVLAIYAKKCGVDRKTLEKDAFSLIDTMEALTIEEDNHFTREDIFSALEMYNDNYITFPIDSISKITAIHIEKNKRNGRKRELHLKLARATKSILKEAGEMEKEGRPSKRNIVREWRLLNPNKTIKDCINETGVSRSTVYKYWEAV